MWVSWSHGSAKSGKKFYHLSQNMAWKGNPILVRLGKDYSSNSSWFTEGDCGSHIMGKYFPSVYHIFFSKSVVKDLCMDNPID